MTDVFDKKTRSRVMSSILSKDTKPELLVRHGLFAKGFRYRKNVKGLPSRPDIVLRKHDAVILVNGCFFHGHDCHMFKWPKSNAGFWRDKIEGNQRRDKRNLKQLVDEGWRTAVVWECAIKGKSNIGLSTVTDILSEWLNSSSSNLEIKGISNL